MKTTISIFNKDIHIADATAYGDPSTLIKCLSNIVTYSLTDTMYVKVSDARNTKYWIGAGMFDKEWSVEIEDDSRLASFDFDTKEEAIDWLLKRIRWTTEGERARALLQSDIREAV